MPSIYFSAWKVFFMKAKGARAQCAKIGKDPLKQWEDTEKHYIIKYQPDWEMLFEHENGFSTSSTSTWAFRVLKIDFVYNRVRFIAPSER